MKLYGHLQFTDLHKDNSTVKNMIIEHSAGGVGGITLPAFGGLADGTKADAAGRIMYNSTENLYYFWNGTTWKPLATGGDASQLQQEVDRIETTLGILSLGSPTDWSAKNYTILTNTTTGSPLEATTFVEMIGLIDTALQNALDERDDLRTYVGAGTGSPAGTLPDYTTNYFVADGDDLTTAIGKLDAAMASSNQLVELVDVATNLGSPANDLSAYESFMFRYDPSGSPYATWTLDSLTLGSLNDVADGIDLAGTEDILAFDGVQWTAITPATFANEITLADLGDVVAGSPSYTTNDLLQWNGTSWENVTASAALSDVLWLNDLRDVTAGSPATHNAGDVFIYVSDGTDYVVTQLTGSPGQMPAQFVESVEDIMWGTLSDTGSPLETRHDNITITYDDALGEFTFSVDDVYVKTAGDTMTGNLQMGSNVVYSSAVPTLDNELVNKAYVDALTNGLSWKDAVVVAYDSNITLSGPAVGDNVGGSPNVVPADGSRVLVMGQTDATQNGIYIVNDAGAWTRAEDLNNGYEFDGAAVFVQEGVWESSGFVQTATIGSPVGTDAVNWNQFTGGAVFTWGTGLVASGNTIDVNLGAGIAAFPADEVGVDIYDHDNASTALGFYGLRGSPAVLTRIATEAELASGDELTLFVDGSTLDQSTGTLKVKANGITGVELNASVAGDALALETIGGSPLTGYELNVKVDGTTITTTGDQLQVVSTITVQSEDEIGSPGVSGFDVAPNGAFNIVGANGITTSDDNVDTVTVTLTGSTANLSNVTADAVDAGQIMVAGADPDNDYTPKQIQHISVQGSATTWTVRHGLGQQWVNVTIVDASNEVIIPESITLTDSNFTTITFNTAVAGKAIIMGVPGVGFTTPVNVPA